MFSGVILFEVSIASGFFIRHVAESFVAVLLRDTVLITYFNLLFLFFAV
jgi:hypothetical protein